MMRHTLRGQALVWLTLMLPVFVSIAGLAIDGAVLLTARREAQSVADGAARAGATEIDVAALRASGGDQVRLDAARARQRASAYLSDNLAREVSWQAQPSTEVQVGSQGVQVTITGEIRTAFLRAVHIDNFPIQASATANVQHGIQQPIP